jgi:hypothetical protein
MLYQSELHGDASNLWLKAHQNLLFYTHSSPVPPNVKEGRITKGKPNSCVLLPLR